MEENTKHVKQKIENVRDNTFSELETISQNIKTAFHSDEKVILTSYKLKKKIKIVL